MRVKKDSSVSDHGSILYAWDTAARKYFEHFDIQIKNYKIGLQKNFLNTLTSFKDVALYHQTFKMIDTLVQRQILGDISKQEVKDVNQSMGSRYCFTKSRAQPATMFAWDTKTLSAFWGFSAFYALYGKFVKRYSIVWLIMPFAPTWLYIFYNYMNQPQQDLENAYQFILTKRAATAEYQKNKAKVESVLNKFPTEKTELTNYLKSHDMTLYELEAEVYDKVARGALR
ncbi:unnamed protein product [Moneuplotes crassus]|uniref:Uncharacterized protein n=1 Tax=Euplotes crassus TaxID=5936 RepID=A0AAD1XXG2_EUPCR|nr:unnamed protein product [Moneuplotes crassus]